MISDHRPTTPFDMMNSPAASTIYLREKRKQTITSVSPELSAILLTIPSSNQRKALTAIEKYGMEMVRFKNGFTALHWAAKSNRLDICKYLISRKADLSIRDDQGKFPVDYATRDDVRGLITPTTSGRELLTQIVDLDSLSQTHRKCLETIASHGWSTLRWGGGWTILHWAHQEGRQDIIQYLKSINVPMDIPDDKGRLPVYYANNNIHTKVNN